MPQLVCENRGEVVDGLPLGPIFPIRLVEQCEPPGATEHHVRIEDAPRGGVEGQRGDRERTVLGEPVPVQIDGRCAVHRGDGRRRRTAETDARYPFHFPPRRGGDGQRLVEARTAEAPVERRIDAEDDLPYTGPANRSAGLGPLQLVGSGPRGGEERHATEEHTHTAEGKPTHRSETTAIQPSPEVRPPRATMRPVRSHLRPADFEEAARHLQRAGSRRERDPACERGTVHTPWPLARWWTDHVAAALRTHGSEDGLASPDLLVIDPACGPGIFLLAVLRHLVHTWAGTAPRLLGLDTDGGAIEVARHTLLPLAGRQGVSIELRVADTLRIDPTALLQHLRTRHLLVLGNPPWSSSARSSPGPLLRALLTDFKRGPGGAPLRHRRIGAMQDACMHFWRWSAEAARAAPGWGAVALLSNASFLDGVVHLGVRARLLEWFDRIHVIELGGGALVARDAREDAPLLPVRPPPAAVLALRHQGSEEGTRTATLLHAAVRGRRTHKWQRLAEGPPLRHLTPRLPHLWLKSHRGPTCWPLGWVALSDIVPFHREGVQTNRDAFVTDPDHEVLLERLARWLHDGTVSPPHAPLLRARPHFEPDRARERLREATARHPEGLAGLLERLAYRPAEPRWWIPLSPLAHRPRLVLRRALSHSQGALLTVGHDRGERPWRHFGWSRLPADSCWHSSRSSCRTRLFPSHRPDGTPNLNLDRLGAWNGTVRIGHVLEPLHYALAILSNPAYGHHFEGLLRSGIPHLPPPPDEDHWRAVCEAGRHLAHAFEALDDAPADRETRPITLGHRTLQAPRTLRAALRDANAATTPLLDA